MTTMNVENNAIRHPHRGLFWSENSYMHHWFEIGQLVRSKYDKRLTGTILGINDGFIYNDQYGYGDRARKFEAEMELIIRWHCNTYVGEAGHQKSCIMRHPASMVYSMELYDRPVEADLVDSEFASRLADSFWRLQPLLSYVDRCTDEKKRTANKNKRHNKTKKEKKQQTGKYVPVKANHAV